MRKLHLMIAAGALALPLGFAQQAVAADDMREHEDRNRPAAAADTDADADNTARNVRDADGGTLTPMDQGENEADRTITQQIRRAVVDHEELSTNAKNVKIITQNGVVTLRGPVKSQEEKNAIAAVAQRTGGVKQVDNQLEVEANN